MRNEEAVTNAPLKRSEVIDKSKALMHKYTGSDARSCQIQMDLNAESRPGETLAQIAQILLMMNFHCIEKKAHRQALAKAGRKALAKLSEMPA